MQKRQLAHLGRVEVEEQVLDDVAADIPAPLRGDKAVCPRHHRAPFFSVATQCLEKSKYVADIKIHLCKRHSRLRSRLLKPSQDVVPFYGHMAAKRNLQDAGKTPFSPHSFTSSRTTHLTILPSTGAAQVLEQLERLLHPARNTVFHKILVPIVDGLQSTRVSVSIKL